MTVSHISNNTYQGLSSDTKPTNVPTGAIFITTDTRRFYIFNVTWNELESSGGSPNAFPEGYSYLVYKSGANYYAKSGVDGDLDFGPSTDAAAIIRSCFDALTAGGTVRLASNTTYDLNSRLVVPGTAETPGWTRYGCIHMKANHQLIGGGMGNTILKIANSLATCGVVVEQKPDLGWNNVVMRDFTVDGNRANNTYDSQDGNQCGIRLGAISNYVIQNVETKNNVQQGAYFTNCQQSVWSRVYAHHNGKEGFAVDAANWTTMIECDAFSNDASGIYMVGGTGRFPSYNTIIGGTLYNNAATLAFPNTAGGLNITDAKYDSIIGVRVIRSGWATLRSDNIFISNCDNIIVTDCISYEAFRAGLLINNSDNITVRGGSYFNNRFDNADGAGSGIYITNSAYCLITGARAFDDRGTKFQRYGLEEVGTSELNTITNCNFAGNNLGHMVTVGALTRRKDNYEFVTDKSGSATVANGNTFIDVTHGLSVTPSQSQTMVTPINNLGNATKFWTSNFGATTFRINVNVDPGATTAIFAWRASAN